jgi:hypothetical protein
MDEDVGIIIELALLVFDIKKIKFVMFWNLSFHLKKNT